MKVIAFEKYGSPRVLHVKEIVKPIPKENEVLIKIHATTATLYDCWQRSSTAPTGFGLLSRLSSGLFRPKQTILGTDLAGEIEEVGKNVYKFKKGDQIYAFLSNLGAYSEYVCLSEDKSVAPKPNNMTYEQAASVPQGALTALYFLRKANIQPGQKVLIFGASGGVGSFAVQIAKNLGAEVTGVCSTRNLELVKSLGVAKVIDYTRDDFTKNREIYDVIFDTVGKSSISKSKKSLRKDGFYVFATFGLPKLLQILWLKLTTNKNVVLGLLEDKAEDLMYLKKLIEEDKITTVVDRVFPAEKAADAHDYVEKKLKKGHVIITFV